MTSPTELLDQATGLAPEDAHRAAEVARSIEDPWFRAQALGHATRYAPSDEDAEAWARDAISAAGDAGDAYRQVVPSTWTIRALLERGQRDLALEILEVVLTAVPRITPETARAEALLQLLHAAFDTSAEVRRSLVFALRNLADTNDHWRIQRTIDRALRLLYPVDADFAVKLGMRTDADGTIRTETPRIFFW